VLALRYAVLACWLLLTACGATSRNGGSSPDAQAAGSSQNAGGLAEGGGGSAAGDAAETGGINQPPGSAGSSNGASGAGSVGACDDPLGGDESVCSGYVQAWRARETENVSGANSCGECLEYNTHCGVGRQLVTDGQDACFFRHCLCDSSDTGCEVKAGSCACFARCLPNPPDPVRRAWFDYMACEVEQCAAVCQ